MEAVSPIPPTGDSWSEVEKGFKKIITTIDDGITKLEHYSINLSVYYLSSMMNSSHLHAFKHRNSLPSNSYLAELRHSHNKGIDILKQQDTYSDIYTSVMQHLRDLQTSYLNKERQLSKIFENLGSKEKEQKATLGKNIQTCTRIIKKIEDSIYHSGVFHAKIHSTIRSLMPHLNTFRARIVAGGKPRGRKESGQTIFENSIGWFTNTKINSEQKASYSDFEIKAAVTCFFPKPATILIPQNDCRAPSLKVKSKKITHKQHVPMPSRSGPLDPSKVDYGAPVENILNLEGSDTSSYNSVLNQIGSEDDFVR